MTVRIEDFVPSKRNEKCSVEGCKRKGRYEVAIPLKLKAGEAEEEKRGYIILCVMHYYKWYRAYGRQDGSLLFQD